MNRRDETSWLGLFGASAALIVGATGAGLLAIAILGAFLTWPATVPLLAVAMVLGLAATGAVRGARVVYGALMRRASGAATARAGGLEATTSALATGASLATRVVGVEGPRCPVGLLVGNTFAISSTGQVTPRLCRPALEALRPLFLLALRAERSVGAACECPLRDRRVFFSVYPAEPVAA